MSMNSENKQFLIIQLLWVTIPLLAISSFQDNTFIISEPKKISQFTINYFIQQI